ncbi:MAG: carboxymuconolactone decarboxylase family protein [Enterobacteriaceae bacterium]|nr:carboxymuconolactone decarboxylase family protein [Enterobacteriaceae bacterium]
MRIDGEAGLKITENLKDISPDLVKFIIEFVFGDIYIRPGLDLVTREIITVSALTAIGYASPQLKVHIHGFLNVGGSQKQLLETIIHTSIYAGFPAAINAAMMMKEVISERSDSGESAQA